MTGIRSIKRHTWLVILIMSMVASAQAQSGWEGMFRCGSSADSVSAPASSLLGCPHPCASSCTGCNNVANRDGVDPVATGPLRRVRLVAHLVRDDYGNAPISIQDVRNMLETTNAIFRGTFASQYATTWGLNWPSADTKIEFCYEIKVYDRSQILAGLAAISPVANAVNVEINRTGGTATGGNGAAQLRYWDVFDAKTCAHELGHALGLYHTHENIGCNNSCEENFLPGTDRDETGDYCSDTDPEPASWGPFCALNVPVELCSGIAYTGDTKYNMMSYASAYPGSCQSVRFSPQQANRMRCFLATNFSLTIVPSCADWVETDFQAQPTVACLGVPIQFLDRSATAGTIATWAWNFGDGFTAAVPNPMHAFSTSGTYQVSLKVTTASGLQETRTRMMVVQVGSLAIPYAQGFDDSVGKGLPARWECLNTQTPLATWHRIRTLTYGRDATFSPDINTWFSWTSGGQPTSSYRSEDVVGPTGNAHGGAMAINNTVRQSGANAEGGGAALAGQRDTLLSPIFDLADVDDPKLRFYYAHIPAALDNLSALCGWQYPGFVPSVAGNSNIFGNVANHCAGNYVPGVSYPTCVDNKISVKYSTDCGSTWLPLVDSTGRSWDALHCYDLNTEPGTCCPFGFTPKAASNWDIASFNLCQLGPTQQVRFMFAYEHGGDNNFFWVDDFSLSEGANPWASAVTTVTDQDCGGTLGSIATLVQPAGNYSMTISDAGGALQAPCLSTGNCTFSNLAGQAGGKPYTIMVTDGPHCAYLRDSVDIAATIPFTLTPTHTCQTTLGGTITVNLNPLPGISYTYTAIDAAGLQIVSNSPIISLPHIGSYTVEVHGNPGGLCGTAATYVSNTGNIVPQFGMLYNCSPRSMRVVFSYPTGPAYVYQLYNAVGTLIATSNTGEIAVPSPYTGSYVVRVVGQGDCGEAPLELTDFSPSFDISVATTPSPICSLHVGTIVVTPSALGVYQYKLTSQTNVVTGPQSSGTFTGLAGGNYTLLVQMLSPHAECELTDVNVIGPSNILVQFATATSNSNCLAPNGQINIQFHGIFSTNLPWTEINNISGSSPVNYYSGLPNLAFCGVFPACRVNATGLPGGTYQVDITHPSQGCSTLVFTVANTYGALQLNATVVNGCTGPNGQVTIVPVGSFTSQPFVLTLHNSNQVQLATVTNTTGQYTFTGLVSGQYTVNVSRNNGAACGSISFTIANTDGVPPTALCRAVTVQLNGAGQASLSPSSINNGSNDNCSLAQLFVNPSAFNCTDLGLRAVILQAEDFAGLKDTCMASVLVQDTFPPIAACAPITMTLDAAGNALVNAAQVDQGSTDNCAITSLALSRASFSCTDLGTVALTLMVTDASSNTATCATTATILDLLPPNATCQNTTAFLDQNGQASIIVADIDGGCNDNCGIATATLSRNTFDCADLGLSAVTLTLADGSGNTSACTAMLTILDTLAPTAMCQNTTIQIDSSGIGMLPPSSINGGSLDNCSLSNLSASMTSFSCAQVGTHSVVLTATDGTGNTGTCIATVTVLGNMLQVQAWTDSTLCGHEVSCAGAQDGTAHVSVQGGCPAYTYAWSNGMNTATATGLGAGSYTVTVQDGLGDSIVTTVTLTAPAAISLTAVTTAACVGDATAAIDLLVSGGNDCLGYTYHWSNGASTEDLVQILAGNYTVTVTDGLGCTSTRLFAIPAWPLPLPAFTQVGNLLAATQSWSSYQWLFNGTNILGATSNNYSVLQTGSYALAVVDSNGCMGQSDSVVVTIVGIAASMGDWETLQLFPNPARGEFKLALATALHEGIDVQIHDIYGRHLLAQRFLDLDQGLTIDIHALAAGSYLVDVTSEGGQHKMFRLVVQ